MLVGYIDLENYFKFTISDTITSLIALIIGYYLAENKNDKRAIDQKIIEIAQLTQDGIAKRDYINIDPENNMAIVLNNKRWLNNQIYLLEKLSQKDSSVYKYVKKLRNTYNEYETMVSENMDQSAEYFQGSDRLKKQKSRIETIEFQLQQVMLAAYGITDDELNKDKK